MRGPLGDYEHSDRDNGLLCKVNGSVNDEGSSMSVTIGYGTLTGYGSLVSATTPAGGAVAAGSSDTAVSVIASSLQPVTAFHYRVVATSAAGTIRGSDASFTTDKATPTVTYPSASAITCGQALSAASLAGGSATYNGAINPWQLRLDESFCYACRGQLPEHVHRDLHADRRQYVLLDNARRRSDGCAGDTDDHMG